MGKGEEHREKSWDKRERGVLKEDGTKSKEGWQRKRMERSEHRKEK